MDNDNHVRSMEFIKYKRDLKLEAQYCQAFKRQKWNTLRKKTYMVSYFGIVYNICFTFFFKNGFIF